MRMIDKKTRKNTCRIIFKWNPIAGRYYLTSHLKRENNMHNNDVIRWLTIKLIELA